MVDHEELMRWRAVVARLVAGTAPRGELFDLSRRVVAASGPTELVRHALRNLLEGAMADSAVAIGDAQEVMRILKAADRGLLDLAELQG